MDFKVDVARQFASQSLSSPSTNSRATWVNARIAAGGYFLLGKYSAKGAKAGGAW